jgi:sulfur relay (sulfurtransferase) DsrC/TusE family protein
MVYVDDMRAQYGRMTMCHMMADAVEELHQMADQIGVSRRWFQEYGTRPHYDICLSKRRLAVKLGAREVTARDLVRMWNSQPQRKATKYLTHKKGCSDEIRN